MKKFVLFDIDGTLVTCGEAPRKAIAMALQQLFGVSGKAGTYSFSGKTDPQIISDLMQIAGIEKEKIQAGIPEVIRCYLAELDNTLRREDVRLLNGIQRLLDELHDRSDVRLGLLTGNVEPGARIKLNRAGIEHLFFNGSSNVGAFGSDSMHRHELPAIAVRRAKEAWNHDFESKDIVVIGDSPNDVLCGKHLNVRSVAVATGWHSVAELKTHEPDFVFDTLERTENVVHAIVSD